MATAAAAAGGVDAASTAPATLQDVADAGDQQAEAAVVASDAAPKPAAAAAPQCGEHPSSSDAGPSRVAAAEAGRPRLLTGSLGRFSAGVAGLQTMLNDLVAEAEAERAVLEEGFARLAADREAFHKESSRVAQVLAGGGAIVKLCVGGTYFSTSHQTLANAPPPCLFSAMFSGRHAINPGPDGAVFIDRDGRYFADILNFLRDGCLAYPPPSHWPADGPQPDWRYLLALRQEAEYYGLTALVAEIDRYPWGLVTVSRGVLNTQDSWLYEAEEGADEVVISVDKPALLLGVGLAGSEGGFTAELEVGQVDTADYSCQVAPLAQTAESFAGGEHKVVRLMLGDPVRLVPGCAYMLAALIRGTDGYCCEDCMGVVVAGGVRIKFGEWESANGTNECRGQFPELYIRPL